MVIAVPCPLTPGYTSSHLAIRRLSAPESSVARCLIRLTRDVAQTGSVALTAGQNGCSELDARRFVSYRTSLRDSGHGGDAVHVVQPGVYLLESLCIVWLSAARSDRVNSAQSDVCVGESPFRPSRRSSRKRGTLVGRSLGSEASAHSHSRIQNQEAWKQTRLATAESFGLRNCGQCHTTVGGFHLGRKL